MPQLGSRWPHCSICNQAVVAAEVLKKVKVLRRSDNFFTLVNVRLGTFRGRAVEVQWPAGAGRQQRNNETDRRASKCPKIA